MKRRVALAILVLILATTSANACPMCYTPKEGPSASQWPILAATGFMLLLPIGLIGGFCFWLRRANRGPSEDQK
jgi:hypothetical protein